MSIEYFILLSLIFFLVLLGWGFKVLHREEWQFLASFTGKRLSHGTWEGINLTYYGVFNALAHILAFIYLLILTGAYGVSVQKTLAVVFVLMAICVPASRLLAGWIEKKANTFTVGGASFVGIILAPAAIGVVYGLMDPHGPIPYTPILAAMAVSYAVGEGVGRLACISFGCCYGKPLDECPSSIQRLFKGYGTVFSGKTKKIAYEKGLDGRLVFPIQALTSTIFILTALAGSYLFLSSRPGAAFLLCLTVTQGWRPLSETLRADYRGSGSLSVYQVLAVIGVIYAFILWSFLPAVSAATDLGAGIGGLWNPSVIIFLQIWGLGIFWYTGKSRVTGANIAFHVHKERT